MLRLLALAVASAALVLTAFTAPLLPAETPTLPTTPFNYAAIELPRHLDVPPVQQTDNTPASNPITDAGATLGRVLFYDTRLSANQTVSCASCHRQVDGFSDPSVLSVGFEGGLTGRHSMSLAFARFYENGHFFWDERAETLEDQVLMPIQDDVEMGMTLDAVRARLAATDFYGPLFADAFGTTDITDERMARALSQFVRSMVAPNTRFDEGRAAQPQGPPGDPLDNFTAQENLGLELFYGRARCSACHRGDLQVAVEALNNGLDVDTAEDEGAGDGRFKTGSLRNIAVTAPYMHDGRFATLEQVVDHYDRGVRPHPNLSPPLRMPNGQPLRLNLNAQERAALVAFLETLTDEDFLTDERWSDPFVTATASEDDAAQPMAVALSAAYPNPFRDAVALDVTLEQAAEATVVVYDLMGRQVAVLLTGAQPAGTQALRWTADGLANGVYVVRLQSPEGTATRTVTLAR
ncbi:MAG: cytochrome c peroxidase, partial [Bacteroidota bacterium]